MMAQMSAIPARVATCRASARASSNSRASSFFGRGDSRKALVASGVGATAALAGGVTTTRAFFGGISKVSGSAHDFVVKDIDGKSVQMADFKGKTLLIVNVASA